MGYTLNTSEAEIVDCGYFISATNKKTGQFASAKNHCGYTNHKMYFSLNYPEKKRGVADIVGGRPEALKEILKRVGLPSYQTLKKHATKEGQKK